MAVSKSSLRPYKVSFIDQQTAFRNCKSIKLQKDNKMQQYKLEKILNIEKIL